MCADDASCHAWQVGTVVEGVVASVEPYGAIIDLGGFTGLLAVEEISQKPVEDTGEVFKEGDRIKVIAMDSVHG